METGFKKQKTKKKKKRKNKTKQKNHGQLYTGMSVCPSRPFGGTGIPVPLVDPVLTKEIF